MFDAWKARRQTVDACWSMCKADSRRLWARLRLGEARAKLAWNRQERRLRSAWHAHVGD